jgi:hypothetical protein
MRITSLHFVCSWQHSFYHLLLTVQGVTDQPTIMPRMVSFQKDIKRYHRLLGHMILVLVILVAHIIICPCEPLNCFCVFRGSVLVAVSTNRRTAFMEAQLAVNAEVRPRPQRHISRSPSILPRSSNSSIMSPRRDPISVSSSDPPFSLFTIWDSTMIEWLS